MTTTERVAPQNLEAEQALLGAMMLSPDARTVALSLVTAASFFRPAHREVFATIAALHGSGDAVDHVTVAHDLRRRKVLDEIGGESILVSVKTQGATPSSAGRYAHIVADLAVLRAVQKRCVDAVNGAYDVPDDVTAWLGDLRDDLAALELPSVGLPASLMTVDQFIAQVSPGIDWLIPGYIARGAKHMLVAPEGTAKSYVLRTLLAAGAQGLDPFCGGDPKARRYKPIRGLMIDAENPNFVISQAFSSIVGMIKHTGRVDYDDSRSWIWAERRRMDLRHGRDRAMLERVVAQVKPDVLLCGPVYKLYTRGEVAGLAAEQLCDVFDDLIDRYGLAVVLEHHAPKGQQGRRVIEPMDSQRFLGWPDIGLTLEPILDSTTGELDHIDVGRFRGDRYPLQWPLEIRRGRHGWMWEATMKDSSWRENPRPEEAFLISWKSATAPPE